MRHGPGGCGSRERPRTAVSHGPGEGRHWRTRDRVPADRGNSTVEFTLVSVLVLFLFLLVLQFGYLLHTRNVLIAAAQEGARYGANADRGPADAEQRASEVVRDALSAGAAARLDRPRARVVDLDGARVMEVTLSGPAPLVLLPAGPVRLRVQGHALEEG